MLARNKLQPISNNENVLRMWLEKEQYQQPLTLAEEHTVNVTNCTLNVIELLIEIYLQTDIKKCSVY